ncbi:LysE family translocator [Jannaschia ovalis]|uniref:LysE family transporter n=1 Tax=Jannaschia ovalis TaxID=3038773 RepID=A0ABY8LGD2_9RHOB|nr:LysE family transporter [Jannaschia sp. GRR-S6-38]WGH79214.1 LysE family transporter [Jannaschia sp. GRR-S6-38]
MTAVDSLLLGLATFAVVCASPGPAILTVVQTAMARGLRPALMLALGLSLALGVWGLLAAAGFGVVLAAAPSALLLLKILGGGYLLWLAFASGRAAASDEPVRARAAAGFRAGLVLNLSNPKAVFAWTATIAVGTPAAAPGLAWLLVPLATILAVAINGGYALVFSRRAMRRAYDRTRRWIDGMAAALFGLAGLALIRDGLIGAVRRA